MKRYQERGEKIIAEMGVINKLIQEIDIEVCDEKYLDLVDRLGQLKNMRYEFDKKCILSV